MLKNTLSQTLLKGSQWRSFLGRVGANSLSISLRRPRALKKHSTQSVERIHFSNHVEAPSALPPPPANILLSSCVLTRHLLARPFYSPLVHQLGSDEVAGVFLANTLFCTSRTSGKHRERVADRWHFPGADNQGSSGRPRPYRRHLSR